MADQINDTNFEDDVLKSDKPVLVDFYADWCGPCKAMMPIIDQVSQDLGDSVKIVKMNIDENPNTPTKFGVRSIPTLILFKNGEAAATKIGGMSGNDLKDWISSNS